jgi:hypothetical protein
VAFVRIERAPIVAPVIAAPDPPATLAGDTFEVNEEGDPGEDSTLSPTTTTTATSSSTDDGVERRPAHTSRSHPARPTARRSGDTPDTPGPSDNRGDDSPGLYGAAGDRAALDLVTVFTREFQSAASADPIWRSLPMGPAGEADVVLTLNESGKLTGYSVSPGASPALSRGIARTLAFIGGRAFTAKGPRTRLHLSATISPNVDDANLRYMIAPGGARKGFALPDGPRIDVRVTAK